MNYAIQHISRMIDDAENIGGMRVGMPKAHVDTSLLRHVIIHYERLEAENTALKARVEELESRSAGVWVPVGERLPVADDYAVQIVGRDVYDYVLVLVPSEFGGKPYVGAGAYHLGEWHCNGPDVVGVTHWLDARLPGGQITSAG